MPKIMLNYGTNGRKRLGSPLNWLLDGAKTNLLRPNTWRMMMMMMIMMMMMKIMSIGLYGCETWSVPVKKVLTLRVLDCRLLGKIFVQKKEQVTRNWRKMYIEERQKSYSTANIYHHHHHHISVMELGHLLTRSGLTYPEASSKVCPVRLLSVRLVSG